MQDRTAEDILARFSDLENNPDETISPYLEFNVGGKLYYFTPGGFLYRRDPGTEEVGGFFCGYLTEEVWRYRTSEEAEAEVVVETPLASQKPSFLRRFFRLYPHPLKSSEAPPLPRRVEQNIQSVLLRGGLCTAREQQWHR